LRTCRRQLVRSVTPLEVKLSDEGTEYQEDSPADKSKTIASCKSNSNGPKESKVSEVDLSDLTTEQQRQAREILCREADAFAQDDVDIGCINLQMKINLTDHEAVQKNYLSIPRPLYPEVKAYIEDLLNRNFMGKSRSPYSSSVGCVRKKDGGMRLCVEYRSLSKKTVPDRHPIPRIQETLDNLGGNCTIPLVYLLDCF
ncbi:Hypothetical predicted protein, partial [Paramuricea clavata]